MQLPKFASNFIAGRSRRSLTMIGLATLLVVGLFITIMQVEPVAKAHLVAMLDKAGFEHVTIGDVSLRPSGLKATDIKLDPYGFDEIKELNAGFNWPAFLSTGKISQLEIKGLNLSRTADSFSSGGRQLANNLLSLPNYRVALSNVTLDLDTGFGVIRLTAEVTAQPGKEDGTHDLQAIIKADQYQLGFSSTWQGSLKKDGMLDLAGDVIDGRMNMGPLRISRFNGWIGTSIDKTGYTLQSQLEAGSATFMDVPLQTISMVNDSRRTQDDVIVRSGISGLPDILFTADLTRTEKDQNFTAILKGKNFGGFLDHIDQIKKSKKAISESLLRLRDFEMVARFQPEKRFVGGPMPFGMTLIADEEKILDGNVLFYPDTFDVRGSLETKPDMALALQDYFRIPSANIVQNFIRLDGDARRFLNFKQKQSEK